MRIKGFSKLRQRGIEVVVGYKDDGEPVKLSMRSPKLGRIEDLNDAIPSPKPPQGDVIRDGRGEAIWNEDGTPKRALLMEDPGYRKEVRDHGYALTIALIFECLLPDQIDVDLVPDDFDSTGEYFLAIREQLVDIGLGYHQLAALGNAAADLCGVNKEKIDAAESLLLGGGGEGNPKSPSGRQPTGSSGRPKKTSPPSSSGGSSKQESKPY